MKIIYLHQHFRKPDQWGSTRSYYLARAMVRAGHEVHLIAGGCRREEEILEGINIHYLPVEYEQSFGAIKRGMVFLKFTFGAWKEARKQLRITPARTYHVGTGRNYELQDNKNALVYASSTPLTVGITALLLKWFQGIPYYFEVRDLWPEAPIEMGVIKNGAAKGLLYYLTRKIYRNAKAIISLSPGITEGIKKYGYNTPIHELSNFSDTDLFKPLSFNNAERSKYLKEGERGIVYFGALGKANHLQYLLSIAEVAKDLPLRFFIVGNGSEKWKLENIFRDKNLTNVSLLPPISKNELPAFLSIMDFSYISFLNLPVLTSCSPNKLFDSLASGKVCITNTRGWMKDLVEKEQCGFYADPLKSDEFIEKIKVFLNDNSLLKTYQGNARKVALERYSEEVICKKLISILDE